MIRTNFVQLGRLITGLLLSALVVGGMLFAGGFGPSTTTAGYHDDAFMNFSMKVIDKRTAVITGKIDAQYGTTPTGTVTFKRGADTLGTATLDGGLYRFELSVPMTWTGDVEIQVVYDGDANHEPSTGTVSFHLT